MFLLRRLYIFGWLVVSRNQLFVLCPYHVIVLFDLLLIVNFHVFVRICIFSIESRLAGLKSLLCGWSTAKLTHHFHKSWSRFIRRVFIICAISCFHLRLVSEYVMFFNRFRAR